MKKKSIVTFVVILILSVAVPVSAEIVEENSMAKALEGTDASTLVVFDIDSTILESAQMLGSDAWFYFSVDQLVSKGKRKSDAVGEVLSRWMQIQKVTDVVPVEKNTPNLIAKLQDDGIRVVALTARPAEFVDRTIEQLNLVGVDLTRNPPSQKTFYLGDKRDPARYFGGAIFCGNGDKGRVLGEFLKKIKLSPKNIIFVDDRKGNVETVDRAMTEMGISCKCVRYGAADSRYKLFDPKVADVELKYFGKILPDDAAMLILNKK